MEEENKIEYQPVVADAAYENPASETKKRKKFLFLRWPLFPLFDCCGDSCRRRGD